MSSEIIEHLFKAELDLKNAQKNNQKNLESEHRQLHEAYSNVYKANRNDKLVFDYDITLSTEVKIPSDILRSSSLNAQSGKILNFDRNVINSFFKETFDLDVTTIEVIDIPKMPEHAEGFAQECGLDDHYVVVSTQNGLYYDLIVHEFGHAIEFTERRKKYTIGSLVHFPLITETVAHYYQLTYMLKNSSKENRIGMLASTTEAYLFSRCIQIMAQHAPKDISLNFELIFNDPKFKDIVIAYQGLDILPRFAQRYKGKNYRNEYYFHHGKRFSVFLAMNCIKHNLDIRELSKIEIPEGDPADEDIQYVELQELLEQTNIDVDLLLDLSTMDDTITKFVDGTL